MKLINNQQYQKQMLMKFKIKKLLFFILYLLFGIEVVCKNDTDEIRIDVDTKEMVMRIILFVSLIDIIAVSIFGIMKLINNS